MRRTFYTLYHAPLSWPKYFCDMHRMMTRDLSAVANLVVVVEICTETECRADVVLGQAGLETRRRTCVAKCRDPYGLRLISHRVDYAH